MSWWSDLVEVVSGTLGGESNITNPSGPVVNDAASKIGMISVIEGIWAGLTDGKLWRSFGWIILGIVLMLTGAIMWVVQGKTGQIAKAVL